MAKQAVILSFVCNLHEHEYIVKGKVLNITPLMCLINGFEENSIIYMIIYCGQYIRFTQ